MQQHGFIYDIRDLSLLKKAHLGKISDTNFSEIKGIVSAAHFLHSNEVSEIVKEKPLPYYYNYFLGNDSSKWASDVKSYQEVTLKNFYDGIDLKVFIHRRNSNTNCGVRRAARCSRSRLTW